jgi:hypothetical protein
MSRHGDSTESDIFQQYAHTPELKYLKLGPPPAKAPFRVSFVNYSSEPQSFTVQHDRESEIRRQFALNAQKRAELHFKDARWIMQDGRILKKRRFADFWARVNEILFQIKPVVIELRINFDYFETELYAGKLPPTLDPIHELKSGYSCDPWKLFISRKGHEEWNDAIVFWRGSLRLLSLIHREG